MSIATGEGNADWRAISQELQKAAEQDDEATNRDKMALERDKQARISIMMQQIELERLMREAILCEQRERKARIRARAARRVRLISAA